MEGSLDGFGRYGIRERLCAGCHDLLTRPESEASAVRLDRTPRRLRARKTLRRRTKLTLNISNGQRRSIAQPKLPRLFHPSKMLRSHALESSYQGRP